MEHLHSLNDSLVFLVAAIVVVVLFRRLQASPVLGYLAAGMLIGPSVLKLVHESGTTAILAEMGVVFLLFTVGLALPFDRLKSLGRYVFGLGLAQTVLTTIAIMIIALALGLPLNQSFIIGCTLSLSSTAVVVQLLSEKGELAAKFGRVSFSILLFQDLAVVVFLILLPILAGENANVSDVLLTSTAKTVLVLMVVFGAGQYLLRPVFRLVASAATPELFTGMTLLVIFVTSVFTASMGLSLQLGAFLAGIVLAGSEYRHQVEADIEPFKGLLLGLFFMTVGMSIDLSLLMQHCWTVLALITCMLLIKSLIIFGLGLAFRLSTYTSVRVSTFLASGGEFVFILIAPAVAHKLLDPTIGQILYVAVAASMALTPFLASFGKWIGDKFQPEFGLNLQAASKESFDLRDHVIIGGFGQAGQIVAQILSENMIPFVIVDLNMARVTQGRARGLPVFFGDIRRLEVLRAIGAARAKVALISIDQPASSIRAVMTLRRHFSQVQVCVRARDDDHAQKLQQSGAVAIVPNLLEPILQMASTVLKLAGSARDEVTQIIDLYRSEYNRENDRKQAQDQ